MKKTFSLVTSILLMASCQTYKKMALAPEPILAQLEDQRQVDLPETFSFMQAAKLMDENNLELKELRQRYLAQRKVADIKTPWPNPTITAGPAFGSDSGLSDVGSANPFIGIGFSIPLGPRLRRNDDVNTLKALAAFNEIVLSHRQLYFDLNQAWIEFSLNQRLKKAQDKISRTLELTEKTAEQLMELGTATRLGVNGIKIRQAELSLKKLEQQIRSREALADLSDLLVISQDDLSTVQSDELSLFSQKLELSELKKLLLDNNPDLARAEIRFHQEDAQLRLELARQYPDLNVGFNFEEEVGEDSNTFSIPFSIELPLFDRNKQAISSSFTARETALTRYRKVLNNKLSDLSKLFRQQELAAQKVENLEKILLPLSRMQLADAKKSLEIGSINILRYLDLISESQQIELQRMELHKEAWQYLIELEKLIGLPLQQTDTSFPTSTILPIEDPS